MKKTQKTQTKLMRKNLLSLVSLTILEDMNPFFGGTYCPRDDGSVKKRRHEIIWPFHAVAWKLSRNKKTVWKSFPRSRP